MSIQEITKLYEKIIEQTTDPKVFSNLDLWREAVDDASFVKSILLRYKSIQILESKKNNSKHANDLSTLKNELKKLEFRTSTALNQNISRCTQNVHRDKLSSF